MEMLMKNKRSKRDTPFALCDTHEQNYFILLEENGEVAIQTSFHPIELLVHLQYVQKHLCQNLKYN